jgi:hypothetical protein
VLVEEPDSDDDADREPESRIVPPTMRIASQAHVVQKSGSNAFMVRRPWNPR